MYLTLPLPVQKKWRHVVFFVPWDLSKPHVKVRTQPYFLSIQFPILLQVPVEIGRDASFKDLRNLLGRWTDAQPDHVRYSSLFLQHLDRIDFTQLLMLEIFSHRFYKNLDDNVLCGEMSDNDVIVCFELPCHAQQSRSYKRQPDSPFVLPVFLCDLHPSRTNVSRGHSLFGYPFIVVVDRHQATNVNALYDVVVERLQRWTGHARDLFTWEAGARTSTKKELAETTELSSKISGTEVEDNGDDVLPQGDVTEGDIADEKSVIIQEDDAVMDVSVDDHPQRVRTKKGIFNLRLQSNYKEYGTSNGYGPINQRFMPWSIRQDDISQPVLLRENDAFFCEFDENMKAYYFGDDRSRWEHARWDSWETFNHPEYEEAKKASAERRNKGISLQDCLDEFTKVGISK
jgi:ubiquitin carboxyl-terminal hydrolase 4/11/15